MEERVLLEAINILDRQGSIILHNKIQESNTSYYRIQDLIQRCSKAKSLIASRKLHNILLKNKLGSITILGNHLIRMYTSCDSLKDADMVFSHIAKPDTFTWNAIIAAHTKLGQLTRALDLYQTMLHGNVKPNIVTFLCIIKACAGNKALQRGRLIHDHVIRWGFEGVLAINNTLLSLYVKSGSVDEAERHFSQINNRDDVTWGVIATGYAQQELNVRTLQLFEKMNQMDLQPSKVVYLSFLKACSAMNSLVHGRQIHDDIVRNGLNSDMQVGSLLIEMYSKCGMLQEAKNVFGRLSKHDVVVWCSLISGYIERDCNLQVLVMFHEMLRAAVRPDRITYIYVLKACGTMDGCQYGWLIHDLLVKDALESDSTILNSLIDMYGKLGNFKDALSSFSMLSYPDQISWGAIITGYVHHGYDELAVQTFADMQKRMIPDKVLFLLILKACKKLGAIRSGFLIHQELVESGMESDSEVARTLIYMYGGCRAIVEATHVFNCSSSKNVELWDALIGACSNHDEHNYIALFLFEKFLQQGFKPNKGIVLCVLGVCGALRTAWEGKCLHDDLIRGESELDQLMENCLIDMYSKCGLLKDARCVFDRLARPSEVSWGAMVAGYVGHGENLAAFELFERMEQMNIKENAVVLSCILKACGDLGASKQGKIVHNIVIKTTLATNDVWNSLVDMYAKCGRMAEAQKVFDGMSNKDLNSWGMLMAGYVQHGDSLKALDLYQKMHMLDIKPNRAVLIYMLQACSITGALVEGRLIFMQLIEDGFELDAVLGNTLLNMYTKCGSIQEACYVFAKLPSRDTASWSVLMGGFAQSNECGLAEKCVELMEQDGLKPGAAIFTSILAVCSHGGFLDKGLKHFSLMNVDHGFLPGEKHLSCINDLLGRAGHFKEAVDLFQSMPVHPDAILWTSLFDKCKQYENQRLGSQCFKELLNLDPDQASWYVLMLKIYANAVDSSAEAKGEETVKI